MKVSIITVCYNSVTTLATALESVLAQSYQNIEYIVVDGGSKDGTVELIRRYADEKFVSSLVHECISEDKNVCLGQSISQSGNQAVQMDQRAGSGHV